MSLESFKRSMICFGCDDRAGENCRRSSRPIESHCRQGECPAMKFPARGLGDTLAKITAAAGIGKCAPCARRQAALNRLLPYRRD